MTSLSTHISNLASDLKQSITEISITTSGAGFYEITSDIQKQLSSLNAEDGLLTVFIKHTSASLTIQENADPDVCKDLQDSLEHLAPMSHPYRHHAEGPDDMPAHIKAMLTSVSLSIPVQKGSAMLGTWQGVYLMEHRTAPHRRQVVLHFMGTIFS